ncbi:BTB domain-containing protein [Caenorhabditis elegans]|uniref:BTB domain-containing protein n=1 Tax=Caenorhabditis elegans TaxID=6239 RepID=Q19838_CAEEL|nr:BTB domain-containing protein [Caenorhabditis elegans]CAA92463.2 BTB domain-containing protein [Caenorhabditis elegans]|eukprot:NP_501703.1 Uncharacterized protein CELE_F27C8.5 [Caenorhabditis elegans]
MFFSNSLHANAAPQHFERIAKILQAKRRAGDFSTCDVKIQLKTGFDMVHSVVICAHSDVFSETFDNQRAPYQPFNMTDFDPDSVRRVFDWMYSGEIDIPETTIADVLAVASYLRVTMLQRQIEQKILNHNGSPIMALNIASARAFSVMDHTMNDLVHGFTEKMTGLGIDEVAKLTANSMIAVMAAVLPMKKKVPLVNMFISWIVCKQPERETINTIIQSLVISDITYDTLYAIRYSLKQYLTNSEIASKSQLTISPSGTIEIKIVPKKESMVSEKSSSLHSVVELPPNQYYRTRSEISAIDKMPDPFVRNLPRTQSASSMIARPRSSGGFPQYFTRSEVEDLQQMTDPFSKSERGMTPTRGPPMGFSSVQCTVKYPGWSKDVMETNKEMYKQCKMNGRYILSEAQTESNAPVFLRPAVGGKVSSSRGALSNLSNSEQNKKYGRGVTQSFSGHSLNDNDPMPKEHDPKVQPSVIISCLSLPTTSPVSVVKPKMTGVKKTDSEIMEINALPSSFNSNSFYTAKTSNTSGHSNDQSAGKSEKSQRSQKSEKSQKLKKPIPQSQYLYPN